MHRGERPDSDSIHLDFADLRAEYGDEDFIADILRVFTLDCPSAMERLDLALSAGDVAEAGRAAHSLRNILGVLRCAPALKLVEEIAAGLRAGDLQSLPGPAARLRGAIEVLVAEGKRFPCS
ncbi:MAG TPA: Hpt domain-containing protein [Rectinemataceae bacterium]|nr:Hpt domain-containing protein [Rectinemataceae bacterium]